MMMLIAAAAVLPRCEPGVNVPQLDLPTMPLALNSPAACADACLTRAECTVYTFHAPNCSYDGEMCAHPEGCCYLKTGIAQQAAPTPNSCTCSAYLKLPASSVARSKQSNASTSKPHAAGARNVLYILVDDLRPELEAYGACAESHHAPNIQRLSSSALTFDNAYCQIAVCSPSRQSFLTGRRPDHSRIYNFIDHFRQSDCGLNYGGQVYASPGTLLDTVHISGCEWGGAAPCGGSGQCCSLCTQSPDCKAWTYRHDGSQCFLYASAGEGAMLTDTGAISGVRGRDDTHASWLTLPQHFKSSGWLVVSSGKVFHTEEGGVANTNPDLNGPGMPPKNDPRSWHEGLSMNHVNDVANMWGCDLEGEPGAAGACAVNATAAGMLRQPSVDSPLCDLTVANDAVLKLRLAADHLSRTGTPFFAAVGFRKPHLAFRFPAPFLDLLPPESETDVAAHRTLDVSVPSIAHSDRTPQQSPYVEVANSTARRWRQYYRAAIAWMDSQMGRVLDELDTLGLHATTLVVMHADHGWSLGEHGEWQKFSNFEHGTRVPLIVRAPWLPQSAGQRTSVLAELVDIFPTIVALAGAPSVPASEGLDGVSLLPVLEHPTDSELADALKPWALSQYMRCPADENTPWKSNDCLMHDRSMIPYMGYSLRTKRWRMTQWVEWNGSSLLPRWNATVGTELYDHEGDDGFDFDAFENTNENASQPEVVAQLSSLLHRIVKEQRRLPDQQVDDHDGFRAVSS